MSGERGDENRQELTPGLGIDFRSNFCHTASVLFDMNFSATAEVPKALSESQKAALIKLLSDDDRAVYHLVRGKILVHGQTAAQWIQPHVLSSDPVLRR